MYSVFMQGNNYLKKHSKWLLFTDFLKTRQTLVKNDIIIV